MLKYVKTRQILTKRLSTVWELKTVKKKTFSFGVCIHMYYSVNQILRHPKRNNPMKHCKHGQKGWKELVGPDGQFE